MARVGRALIVGAGIGGLSTAAALQKIGFDADVFEQAAELREAGVAVGLWSNSMASLDQLGAGDAVRQSCLPLRTIAITNERGRNLALIKLDELGAEFASAACFVVLRPVLLAALAARVCGTSIHTNCRVVRAETIGERVRVHLDDGRVEEGDLLVGADGLNSAIRPLVVGADEVRYSGQTCFRGVARVAAPELSVLRELHGAGLRAGLCPVDAQTVYWWTSLNSPPGRSLAQEERKSFNLERFKGWAFGLEEAIAATPGDAIVQNDLVDRAPARRYARGRLVLIGDAAHPTTPNLGQGANMAIDDGIVLARCLRDSGSIPAALERYQEERLRRTRQIVKRSWNYGRMSLWTSAAAVGLREAAVRLIPKPMSRSVMRWQILEGVGSL